MSASRKSSKDSTPPPLLLMRASEGLTTSPSHGASLLMPVPQKGSSLLFSEEGEMDSFLGQSPASAAPSSTIPTHSHTSLFPRGPAACSSEPFSQQTSTPPFTPTTGPTPTTPASTSSQQPSQQSVAEPPPMTPPPMTPPPMTLPPTTQSFNRPPGPMHYAQPPTGTYAQPAPTGPYGQPPPFAQFPTQPPPMAAVPPTMHTPSGSRSAESGSAAFGGPPTPVPSGGQSRSIYLPVTHHWFYSYHFECTKKPRTIWKPFSTFDSDRLEKVFLSHDVDVVVDTDGGRFDVDVTRRLRTAIYWTQAANQVVRSSWFYKPDGDSRLTPYDEDFAEKLEVEYKKAIFNNSWHKRLEFHGGNTIVMHNPTVIVHFTPSSQPDEWGTTIGEQMRPRVVKRGLDESISIDAGECSIVDHLVLVVHGIGPTCDLKFRNIVECVDDLRAVSQQMAASHFQSALKRGQIGRVEFLPVRWHAALHGDATGIDSKLKSITLPSIAKLRSFTNETLLDVLFYSSPTYAQHIADAVTDDMHRLHAIFLERNPRFSGAISVAGHSLGSLILFDLLAHQKSSCDPVHSVTSAPDGLSGLSAQNLTSDTLPTSSEAVRAGNDDEMTLDALFENLGILDYAEAFHREKIDMESLMLCEESDLKEMGLPMGPRKKLQGYLHDRKHAQEESKAETRSLPASLSKENVQSAEGRVSGPSAGFIVGVAGAGEPLVCYRRLRFEPAHCFLFGSPVAMFLTVRGGDPLGPLFTLPTCPALFNIFHPFDPVAYRLEPLLVPQFPPKPFLMPHHKGRKRLHLELRESLSRVGSDLKQRILETFRSTWQSFNEFALAHKSAGAGADAGGADAGGATAPSVAAQAPSTVPEDTVLVDQVISQLVATETEVMAAEVEDVAGDVTGVSGDTEEETNLGSLNGGRRVDYVLQEAPLESFNDYLFALGSHMCYWESEDTILLILKEIYAKRGISPVMPPNTALLATAANSAQGLYTQLSAGATYLTQSSGQDATPSGTPPAPPPLSGFVRSAKN